MIQAQKIHTLSFCSYKKLRCTKGNMKQTFEVLIMFYFFDLGTCCKDIFSLCGNSSDSRLMYIFLCVCTLYFSKMLKNINIW